MAGVTRERDEAIRIQFSVEIARGTSPSLAVKRIAYRSGLKQAQVREIVQQQPQPPATRRLPQEARA